MFVLFEYLQPPLTTPYATAIYRIPPQPLSGPCPLCHYGYGWLWMAMAMTVDMIDNKVMAICEDGTPKWATHALAQKIDKIAFVNANDCKRGRCRGPIFALL